MVLLKMFEKAENKFLNSGECGQVEKMLFHIVSLEKDFFVCVC